MFCVVVWCIVVSMKFFTRASKAFAEPESQQLSPVALTREILNQIQNESSQGKLPMFALALSAATSTDVSYSLKLQDIKLELESWRSTMPVFDDQDAIDWWIKKSSQYIACLVYIADQLRSFVSHTRDKRHRKLAASEAKRLSRLIIALSYLTGELNPSHMMLARHFVQLQEALSLSDEHSLAFREVRRLRNEYFIEATAENLGLYIAAVEEHFTESANPESRTVFRRTQRAVATTFDLLAQLEAETMLQGLDS